MCAELATSTTESGTEPEKSAPTAAIPSDAAGENESTDAHQYQDKEEYQLDGNDTAPPTADPQGAMARERKRLARKRKRESQRLKRRHNTSVYITGLPTDVTEQELAEYFAKCGIILPSAETGRPRAKLYMNEEGNCKGDGLVTYAMQPSVENAVTLLDNVPIRVGGKPIRVQAATFDHKRESEALGSSEKTGKGQEEGDTGKRPKHSFRAKDLVQEALSWAEEGQEVSKATRIVVLKNVFDAKNADYDLVREDMEEGCGACGTAEKITIFERSREGAVAVKFTTLEACLECIKVMNGRWYDGRKLTAEFYDGMTDYRYKETEEDRLEREKRWQEWLDTGGEQTDSAPATS